jgi:hypothetical protein
MKPVTKQAARQHPEQRRRQLIDPDTVRLERSTDYDINGTRSRPVEQIVIRLLESDTPAWVLIVVAAMLTLRSIVAHVTTMDPDLGDALTRRKVAGWLFPTEKSILKQAGIMEDAVNGYVVIVERDNAGGYSTWSTRPARLRGSG